MNHGDVPETTTKNRTSDTETVQSETGQNGHAGHETNQTVDLHDQPAPSLRRSTRIRRPPDLFGDYVSH